MRIFFEGPQGSGKTTLAKLLHEELGRRGIEIPLQRGIPTIDFMKEHSEQAN